MELNNTLGCIVVFLLQQVLRERAKMLGYVYVHCLSYFSILNINQTKHIYIYILL